MSIENLPSAPETAAASSVTIIQPRIHGCTLQVSRTVPAPPIGLLMLRPGTGSATLKIVRPFSCCACVVWRIGSLLVVRTLAFGRTSCTRGAKRHFSFMITRFTGAGALDAGEDHHRVRETSLRINDDRLVGQLVAADLLIDRHAHRRRAFRGSS